MSWDFESEPEFQQKLDWMRSFIDAELIIRAKKLGFDVVQFGTDYFPRTRGESTLASASVIRTILREMFRLRKELRLLRPVVTPAP